MKIKAIEFTQADAKLYLLAIDAKQLWKVVRINERTDDKVEGYQRALSSSRAQDIKRFVLNKNIISPAIIVSFDSQFVTYDNATGELNIVDNQNAGWVIDGQHRLRGASLAAEENSSLAINLPVVAFLGLDIQAQIAQFVTINKEAKGVPTSLYYDLLKLLPVKKNNAEVAKEKAAAIADQLRKDENSAFYDRIVVVTTPKKGEISLTNFVRKVSPLLAEGKGALAQYSQHEVCGILDNYFKGLKVVFPEEFSIYRETFFKTLGFGAIINAMFYIFSYTLRERKGFTLDDAIFALSKISDFNFSQWERVGTGSAAEIQAGRDLEAHFMTRIQDPNQPITSILKL